MSDHNHHTNDPSQHSFLSQVQRWINPDLSYYEQTVLAQSRQIVELQAQLQQSHTLNDEERRQWYKRGKEAAEKDCLSNLTKLMDIHRPPCPRCQAPMAYTCLFCGTPHITQPLVPHVQQQPPHTDYHLPVQGIRDRVNQRIARSVAAKVSQQETIALPTPRLPLSVLQQARRNEK